MSKKKNTPPKEIIVPEPIEEITLPVLSKNYWLPSVFLILISFVLYHSAIKYGYVLDDQIVITDNKFTKEGFNGIWNIISTESMTGYFDEQKNLVQGNRYRPLSLISFAMEYGVLGDLNPSFSHFINILLFGLTGVLIFLLLSKLFTFDKKVLGIPIVAFFTALLFIVHPLHVEAVANIKGRDEIMALLFSLYSLYYGLSFIEKTNFKNAFLACFMLFLGLLSKENSITFLAVIPLTLYFFTNGKFKNVSKLTLFLLGTVIVYLFIRFSAAGVPKFDQKITDLMNNPFLGMKNGEKPATILYTLLLYIKLLFVPYPLTHDYYPYAIPIMNFSKWQVWLALLTYGSMAYFGLKGLGKKSVISFSLLYYLVTLTIVSNVVINLGTFMNDRFVYMASLGFCLYVAYGIYKLVSKYGRGNNMVMIGSLLVPTIAFALLSYIRVPDWESALALNKSALKVSKNSARANSFMATALYNEYLAEKDPSRKKKLIEEAAPYAEKAIEIFPTYLNGNIMMAGVAAERYKMNGKLDSLLVSFKDIIKKRPDVPYLTEYLKYLNGRGTDFEKLTTFYYEAARILIAKNSKESLTWAIHYLNLGMAINPNSWALNDGLGNAYELLGDTNKAAQFKSKAATLK